jgi:hypothetical protein
MYERLEDSESEDIIEVNKAGLEPAMLTRRDSTPRPAGLKRKRSDTSVGRNTKPVFRKTLPIRECRQLRSSKK